MAEETRNQANIERIASGALPLLEEASDPSKVDDDWIVNFFDKCRIVSNEEMQILWSKVLAGEANAPGSFSKRTISVLASLDRSDAFLFQSLCQIAVAVVGLPESSIPFFHPTGEHPNLYDEIDINFGTLTHLEDLGLTNYLPGIGYRRVGLLRLEVFRYFDTDLLVEFKNETNNEFNIGKVRFTRAGHELLQVCGAKPLDQFVDHLVTTLTEQELIISSPWPRGSNYFSDSVRVARI